MGTSREIATKDNEDTGQYSFDFTLGPNHNFRLDHIEGLYKPYGIHIDNSNPSSAALRVGLDTSTEGELQITVNRGDSMKDWERIDDFVFIDNNNPTGSNEYAQFKLSIIGWLHPEP